MLSKLRAHVTYANVVSSACLFILLGGTAYAAATGSIGTRELKDDDVLSRDIDNDTIQGEDIREGTITGRNVSENSLHHWDIANNNIGTTEIQDGSLLARDFKAGQLDDEVPNDSIGADELGSIITRRATAPLPENSNKTADLGCNVGEQLISGGASVISFADGTFLAASRPLTTGLLTTWRASARNEPGGGGDSTVLVWVNCLQ